MTRDDIIRMAREAGMLIPSFRIGGGLALGTCTVPDLERFAGLVAAAEREACAQPRPAEPAAEEDDGLYWRLHSISKSLESCGFLDEHDNPDAYGTVLDAMAFVQQHEACATPNDRAKWYFKQVAPSGTVVARAPDGVEFVVKGGNFDTGPGRELLNAMLAALSGP